MVSKRVRVTSFHAGTFGGGILIGQESGVEVRARIPASILPREPEEGETWRVTGRIEGIPVPDYKRGGTILRDHVIADVALPLVPSGAGIQLWIARNKAIPGVGEAYAERLWDALGPQLYDHLRSRNVAPLAAVLDVGKACAIIDAWGLFSEEVSALQALDELGIAGGTAITALRLFGGAAAERFAANPYLLTLLEPWAKVDAAALSMGVLPPDRRRLEAAVDTAAAQAFRTTDSHLGGHTVVTRNLLVPRLGQLLRARGTELANAAIDHALSAGILRDLGEGRMQARAPWLMEREIEEDIARRVARLRSSLSVDAIDRIIDGIQVDDGIVFDAVQREAVHAALTSGVTAIAGGAGTGKSTICKAIARATRVAASQDAEGLAHAPYMQIAVSGRAAKRLREATGENALTVYRYLKLQENRKLQFAKGLLLIDEFSMVGTPDLWRVLTLTPPNVDVVLVGDVAQLPPIKAGYPALSIMASRHVPKVTLTSTHRQAAGTGIPTVAAAVRNGQVPRLRFYDLAEPHSEGVYFVPCTSEEVPKRSLEVFAAIQSHHEAVNGWSPAERLHKTDVQLLCMTKAGPAGTKRLSESIEQHWLARQPSIHNWGLRVGSKILWTQNSYDRELGHLGKEAQSVDIMNGALGMVQAEVAQPRPGAMVQFDDQDVAIPIWEADLDRIALGWAITVHKAQGSAFRRVIIPVVPSRLLDRSMLYTAITRAKQTCVLVGDPTLFASAVQSTPSSWRRNQALNPDSAIERLREAP